MSDDQKRGVQTPDLDDYAALDEIFVLPDNIDDPDLRVAYELIVARMRKEASHCAMSTVQQLLIERIAYNYVVLRWNEARDSFAHTTAQKEFNSFWLSMTQEFNRTLRVTDQEYKTALLGQIAEVISETMAVEDQEVVERIMPRFVDAFKKLGL